MGESGKHGPEYLLAQGIFAHRQKLVCIGDTVEAGRNLGFIVRGMRLRIADIALHRRDESPGYDKRLLFEEFPGQDFNPKRFDKTEAMPESFFIGVKAIVIEALEPQVKTSREGHDCPDLTPLLPAIASALASLSYEHSCLKPENKYQDEPYYSFQKDIATVLRGAIDEDLFIGYKGQKRFLIHMWTGVLAHALWEYCLREDSEEE